MSYRVARKIRGMLDQRGLDELVAKVNALLNMQIVNGPPMLVGEKACLLKFPATVGGGSYTGEWDAAKQYDVQMIATRGVLGEFVCVAKPPVGIAPETGAPYWHAWQSPIPATWG